MSSPAFDAPLRLEVRPSRALRVALVLLHVLAALAALALLPLPAPWVLAGAAVLIASGGIEWRRARQHQRLLWRADGAWEHPGATGECRLHASTFVSPWLVVLALQDGRRVRRWVLVRDALPPVVWRRLRARLHVAGPALAGEHA